MFYSGKISGFFSVVQVAPAKRTSPPATGSSESQTASKSKGQGTGGKGKGKVSVAARGGKGGNKKK